MQRLELPLASSTWSTEEIAAALSVLQGGHTTMGLRVEAFESAFAKYIGSKYAVMVNSGSSANLLMVAALVYSGRLPMHSRVAVPAICWSTTISPLIQFGMTPVIVDVDETLNIDPKRIPSNVDAVFAVNVLGRSCPYYEFEHNDVILEDNCEALGAEYGGCKTGRFGMMASHSLFFSHHISTMEGGVITTDREDMLEMLLMLRSHGWTRSLPNHKPGFGTSWEFKVPGYNVRPTEVQAAIGMEQLAKLPEILGGRRANADVYRKAINHVEHDRGCSWFGFPVFAEDRKEAFRKLGKGVEVRPILAGNILRHDIMKHAEFDASGVYPTADHVHDHGFFIGNHAYPIGEVLYEIAARLGISRAA